MATALLLQGVIVAIGSLLFPWLTPASSLHPSSRPMPDRRDPGASQPPFQSRVSLITPARYSTAPDRRP